MESLWQARLAPGPGTMLPELRQDNATKMKAEYLGLEIGGTKLQIAIGDADGMTRKARASVDPELGGAGIRAQIEEALPKVVMGTAILAAGVGFGGPVDWRSGRIQCSHQIEGWSGFDFVEWFRALLGVPVFVENDANVAALGEARQGAGRGCNPVFYVTLGSGVGGGLVADGKIYHGAAPGEAEIGHVRLDRSGAIVESRCSGWAVDARIRQTAREEPEGILAALTRGMNGGEAKKLREAIERGDRTANRILVETAEDLALGLSHAVHLCHPERIILGGGLSLIGEPLRNAVAEMLPGFVMSAFQPAPQIALAVLGEDAVPIGALELARSRGVNSDRGTEL